jgi:hypothetical protein
MPIPVIRGATTPRGKSVSDPLADADDRMPGGGVKPHRRPSLVRLGAAHPCAATVLHTLTPDHRHTSTVGRFVRPRQSRDARCQIAERHLHPLHGSRERQHPQRADEREGSSVGLCAAHGCVAPKRPWMAPIHPATISPPDQRFRELVSVSRRASLSIGSGLRPGSLPPDRQQATTRFPPSRSAAGYDQVPFPL